MFAKIENGAVAEWPIPSLFPLFPHTSFPSPLTPADLPDGYVMVGTTEPPPVGPTQQCVPGAVFQQAGQWVQGWDVVDKPAEDLAQIEASRIASLWQAAHDYEFAQVSGSAIGLLAIGVMQQLPKCTAVQNWIKGIWTVYYTRKAGTSTDTDFSVAGTCPHSVPELMAELGL